MNSDDRPEDPRPPKTVTIPRPLVEQTVAIILQLPANQVYRLVAEWEHAVPDLLVTPAQ